MYVPSGRHGAALCVRQSAARRATAGGESDASETRRAVLCSSVVPGPRSKRRCGWHSHLKRNISHRLAPPAAACTALPLAEPPRLSVSPLSKFSKNAATRDRTCLSERREALIAVPHARCSEGSLSRRHRRNHTPTSASAFSAADAELRKLLLGRMQLGREREVLRAQRRVLRLQDLRVAL